MNNEQLKRRNRRGLTLVELLIVIAIISILIQLTLPAIQASRESARQSVCQNNLRQLGIATQIHLGAQRHFPTGGWTSVYVGDPNRGYGKKQPGGWCYNVLPFTENQHLHEMGKGQNEIERRAAAAEMFATPVPLFVCPSRRLAYPWRFNRTLFNSFKPEVAGRSDYAACMGNLQPSDQRGPGPTSYEEAAHWIDGDDRLTQWVGWSQNGVAFQRSEVTPQMVTDGLSKTYLIGEKFLAPKYYEDGRSDGDDQSLYVGFDRDNARSTNSLHPPLPDADIESDWVEEGDNDRVVTWNFGSAHPSGLNMATCDGAVELIAYEIDPAIYVERGSRDGSARSVD
jgi:prepilin-type N-terminal cleavage/methylation domain-containing protein